ncbi:hypothetical protein M8C21_024860 [Ambrosia artemisiifolia]|uniref:Uncharacterized protein n=1 Tax=Ambrosia artemisiifolia TaxID=4212 RepID=A0AAD5CG35_AMBAR|nr:hypothetical protein M8C21_024860 [Ambrosia artemisiifolia]
MKIKRLILASTRGDVVQVSTWVARNGKNSMRRDWLLRDYKTGEMLIRASRGLQEQRSPLDKGRTTNPRNFQLVQNYSILCRYAAAMPKSGAQKPSAADDEDMDPTI